MLSSTITCQTRCRVLSFSLSLVAACALGAPASPASGELAPLGPSVPVELDGSLWAGQAAIAASPGGGAVLVWTLHDALLLQRFDAAGVPVGESRAVTELLVSWREVEDGTSRQVAQSYSLGFGPCRPTATTLCLGGGRFAAEALWRDPRGAEGQGRAVPLAADTGGFWFFDADNLELAVKILDASSINGRFWVFYGALTNVELTLVVRDLETGAVRQYFNPLGRFGSGGDTEAFPGGGEGLAAGSGALHTEAPGLAGAPRSFPGAGAVSGACIPGEGVLCLAEGRFQVEVEWEDPHGGAGSGEAVPLTADTGAFWFFGPGNVELLVKVLDARAFDGHFWVFYGSLTNVAFTLTVTDTETGAAKTYTNPQGTFASVGDTRAF